MLYEMPLPKLPGDWERSEHPESPAVAPARWGRDHFQTLLYLESVAVDKRGIIDNRKMRCNPRRHRPVANVNPVTGTVMDGSRYPTRLAGGEELSRHDDWDIVDDLAGAGLLDSCWRRKQIGPVFGFAEVCVSLSPAGLALAARLRSHLAQRKPLSSFVMPALEELQ